MMNSPVLSGPKVQVTALFRARGVLSKAADFSKFELCLFVYLSASIYAILQSNVLKSIWSVNSHAL